MTWVCGEELVLVQEILDFTRDTLQPAPTDHLTFTAGSTPDRDIWAACGEYPMDTTKPRLITVKEAQKIKNWAPLIEWMSNLRLLPTTYLLFISSEEDFAYTKKRSKDTPSEMAPHLVAIKSKGTIVRCAPPSEEDTISWMKRQLPVNDDLATYILTRAGGDLGIALNIARKARVFQGRLTPEIVDLLCSGRASDSFVDYLIFQKKPEAFKALALLPEKENLRTIGLLDSRLDTLAKLYEGVRKGQGIRELAINGVPPFLAKFLMPIAKFYDPGTVASRRGVLAAVDHEVRRGARGGTMESLVALW